ncbi:FecR family protein [Butyricimonas synergistica]|uniref:FecR family protein n=1 Tax=Butyricimonas synergistica TaxID=544644 RepID=UPI00036AD8B5|nr:FecR domain-containing protein [Butyricimonas synergistica]
MAISDYIEDLIYRVLAGDASEEERQVFEEWVRENEEHRLFFREVERAWYTGKYSVKWRNVEESAAWQAVEHKRESRRRKRIIRIGWSVAAAIVLLLGMTWVFFPSGKKTPVVAVQSVVKPGGAKAVLVLSTGVQVVLGSERADTIQEKGFSILNVADYIDYSRKDSVALGRPVYNELRVPTGGEFRLVLADGTVVYMNSESRLKYPVRFTGDERLVELEGEAYFDVSRDEVHPFVVRTERLDVTVLGTGFNVMAYKKGARTEVTLVSGSVDVTSGKISEVLTPNHQFVMNNESREYEVKTVNVDTYVDWKNGILNFDAMPLDELADKLGRWYEVSFFFSKESLKQLKFTGAFRKYNDIDYILFLIESTTNVTFKVNGNVITVNEK